MCLAVPARITELLPDDMAEAEIAGTRRQISVMMLEDKPSIGDFVLIHVGYAIETIDEEEARRTLELLAEMGSLNEELPQGTQV